MADRPGDRHLQRQLTLVYQADIKTIDAFCTALVRENVHLLDFGGERGLTADFRVLDEGEAALLRRRVLPRVLEEVLRRADPGGAQLADAFGFGRDDSRLEDLVLDLHAKIQSHAYPERWLAEQRESWAGLPEDVGETAYGRELLAAVARKARHWAALLAEGLDRMAGMRPSRRPTAPPSSRGPGCSGSWRRPLKSAGTGRGLSPWTGPGWGRRESASPRNCGTA